MSMPNLSNNITNQNIVINQVQGGPQITHTLLNNVAIPANNGIPLATAIASNAVQQQQQSIDQVNVVPQTPSTHANLNLPMKTYGNSTAGTSAADSQLLLTKTRMIDLIRDIDPNIYMEEEVEEFLLGYVDDFVDRVLNGASIIAKHRHVKNIEVKDVQMFVSRNYNMWAPGLGTDALRPYKRSLTTESHKQRLALIRKALKKY